MDKYVKDIEFYLDREHIELVEMLDDRSDCSTQEDIMEALGISKETLIQMIEYIMFTMPLEASNISEVFLDGVNVDHIESRERLLSDYGGCDDEDDSIVAELHSLSGSDKDSLVKCVEETDDMGEVAEMFGISEATVHLVFFNETGFYCGDKGDNTWPEEQN